MLTVSTNPGKKRSKSESKSRSRSVRYQLSISFFISQISNVARSDSRRKRSEGPSSGAHGGAGERKAAKEAAALPAWDKITKDNVSGHVRPRPPAL